MGWLCFLPPPADSHPRTPSPSSLPVLSSLPGLLFLSPPTQFPILGLRLLKQTTRHRHRCFAEAKEKLSLAVRPFVLFLCGKPKKNHGHPTPHRPGGGGRGRTPAVPSRDSLHTLQAYGQTDHGGHGLQNTWPWLSPSASTPSPMTCEDMPCRAFLALLCNTSLGSPGPAFRTSPVNGHSHRPSYDLALLWFCPLSPTGSWAWLWDSGSQEEYSLEVEGGRNMKV